jgi:arsenate reductase
LEIHRHALRVMEEASLDMTRHQAKGIDQWLGQVHFGHLIPVCAKAEKLCPTLPGVGRHLFWPTEDPVAFEGSAEEKMAKCREARDGIEKRILEWLTELAED